MKDCAQTTFTARAVVHEEKQLLFHPEYLMLTENVSCDEQQTPRDDRTGRSDQRNYMEIL
jgi:hypothetical protein